MITHRVHSGSNRSSHRGCRRGRSRPAVAALVAAGAAALLTATLLAVPHAAASPARVLRVLSFNVHTGIGSDDSLDLDRTATAIRDSGADVVALQEVDVHWSDRSDYADQATELARLTGMRAYFAPIYDLDPEPGAEDRRRFGLAVLSRHPVLSATNHEITRWSTVDPDSEPAPAPGFAEVIVSVRGVPVHLYNTHLDFRPEPEIRRQQVADMLAILSRDPGTARQVLMGDFNAEPSAPELAPLFAHLRDAWGARPGGATFPAADPVKRIDYVTVAGPVRVLNTVVPVADETAQPSDHLPVHSTLLLR